MIFAVAESIALRDDFGRTPMQLDVKTVFSTHAERAESRLSPRSEGKSAIRRGAFKKACPLVVSYHESDLRVCCGFAEKDGLLCQPSRYAKKRTRLLKQFIEDLSY